MLTFVLFEKSRGFSALQNLTLFSKSITSKYAQEHHMIKNQKNSFTGKKLKSNKLAKKGQKWLFFGPGGPNFKPFFKIFCKALLNMAKNSILKNQKNSFTRKISKSEKLRKWQKKGQKWPFFDPGGPNFDPFFTIFCKSLLNMPPENHYTSDLLFTECI